MERGAEMGSRGNSPNLPAEWRCCFWGVGVGVGDMVTSLESCAASVPQPPLKLPTPLTAILLTLASVQQDSYDAGFF